MTPLICEESWHEWPAKHWSECFSHELFVVFPNWIDSLATGEATFGSYLLAAILCLLVLFAIAGIIGAISAVWEAISNRIADWFGKHPRASIWARFGLLNLLPALLAIGFIYGWIGTGIWDEGIAKAVGILIAAYYTVVGLIIVFGWPGEWNEIRRAEKRKAQRK